MVLEGYEGDRVLLSYDVDGTARSAAARACQIVFGRARLAAGGSRRQEEGFVHRPGVVWIGQSVFVLPPRDAEELALRLRRLGVRVAMARVTIPRTSLEAFRRPESGHALTSTKKPYRMAGASGVKGGIAIPQRYPSHWLLLPT